MKFAWTFFLCILFSTINSLCLAQDNFEEWNATDKQLSKTVTLQESKITIGEALQAFSKQTGVKILMDANKEESGVILFVHLKNTPLANALEAISSLLSLPRSKWQWGRSGSKNLWVYKLYPASLADLDAALRFQARTVFKDYIAFLRGYVALSPEEQDKQKSLYSKAMLQKSDATANAYLDARKEGLISRMKVMLDLLDDQGIDAVLDQGAVTVPFANLNETQKAAMVQYYKQYHVVFQQDGVQSAPSTEPTSLTMQSVHNVGSKKHVMPNILLSVGESISLTCLGPGVSGGFIHSLGRAWILPGDTVSHPLEETLIPEANIESRTVKVNDEAAPGSKRQIPIGGDYENRLASTSISTSIPIIAVLNREDRKSNVEPLRHTTLKKFLFETEYGLSLLKMHKWRMGILLISTPDWMMSQDSIIPVSLIKKMEKILNRPSREGLLKEVCNQFVTISTPKWQGLVQRFPQFSIVVRNPSFFRFAANYPNLFQSTGIELNEDIIQAIMSCLPETNRKTLDNARRVRWRTVSPGMKKEDPPVFAFEVLDSKGAWEGLASSSYLSVMDGSDYSP